MSFLNTLVSLRGWFTFHQGLAAVLLLGSMLTSTMHALAAPPRVEFDATEVVATTDVSTPEFRVARPSEKLIAARIELSALMRDGDARDVVHLLYRLETLDEGVTVFDYAPKTTLVASAAGNVAVEHATDADTRFTGKVRGQYFPFAVGDATLDRSTSENAHVRYEMPSPRELLSAAGTTQRHRGVYFKLRPTRQTTLEGAKSFVIVFAAPESWRAGRLAVHAEARGAVGGALATPDATADVGEGSFQMGLYLTGDTAARNAVATLVKADQQWSRAEAELQRRQRKDVAQQMRRTFDEIAALVDTKDAKRKREAHDRRTAESRDAKTARDAAAAELARLNGTSPASRK